MLSPSPYCSGHAQIVAVLTKDREGLSYTGQAVTIIGIRHLLYTANDHGLCGRKLTSVSLVEPTPDDKRYHVQLGFD